MPRKAKGKRLGKFILVSKTGKSGLNSEYVLNPSRALRSVGKAELPGSI
jgi:hypothetical protein